MSEPYLILHKVRGEAAFDVAERCCPVPRPCQPDCGAWNGESCSFEGEWVIPTSGHTAYPIKHWPLAELADVSDINKYNNHNRPYFQDEVPEGWPDHYSCNDKNAPPESRVQSLLDRIGLGEPTLVDRRS